MLWLTVIHMSILIHIFMLQFSPAGWYQDMMIQFFALSPYITYQNNNIWCIETQLCQCYSSFLPSGEILHLYSMRMTD